MNEYVALILGVVCAGIGGELFVRGAVGLCASVAGFSGNYRGNRCGLRHPRPELSVLINAAMAGNPKLLGTPWAVTL